MSNSNNVLPLAQQDISLRCTSITNGGEYHGPCPGCGGKDRFIVWPNKGETGRYWCRRCDRKGDAIQYLCDFQGLSFIEAKRALGLQIVRHPHRQADRTTIERMRASYFAWETQEFLKLTNRYRALQAEREEAAIAYRALNDYPNLLTPAEREFWTSKLASIYDRLAPLEYEVDIFTYKKYEPERFARWGVEQQKREAA